MENYILIKDVNEIAQDIHNVKQKDLEAADYLLRESGFTIVKLMSKITAIQQSHPLLNIAECKYIIFTIMNK